MSDPIAYSPGASSPSTSWWNVLVFRMDDGRYGLRTDAVREIVQSVRVLPLPDAPRVVEGVVNVRGNVVPVLDVRMRFGLLSHAPVVSEHLIVARTSTRTVAFRVDEALEILSVSVEDVEGGAWGVHGLEGVAGVAKVGSDLVVIHDLETFLRAGEIERLDAALEAA